MIITRTPLRISLFGGGTDLPDFYRHYGGACISFCIDKHIFVSVNEKFDGRTRVSYSEMETVDDPRDLKHDLVREALALFNRRGLEISSVADIPGGGTGLGSSSAFTVGLLAALSAENRHGTPYCRSMLAETAYTVEANLCGHPVGKQDQYAAAYGSLHYYGFTTDGTVQVQPIAYKSGLFENMLLLWTGRVRSANEILKTQAERIKGNENAIRAAREMHELADCMADQLEKFDYSDLGKMLHLAWKTKKTINPSATDEEIDRLYSLAMRNGAQGAKICGAGGGGFLLVVAPQERHAIIQEKLRLRRIPFGIDEEGSKVIYYGLGKNPVC